MNPPTLIGGSTPATSNVAVDGFDAYSATVFAHPDSVLADLELLMESAGMWCMRAEGPKVRFYARNDLLLDAKGHRLLSMKSGGSNPHPHVECTGRAAPFVARFLRDNYRHRPTRIDHAVDRRAPDLFDDLHAYAKALCKQHGLKLGYGGDWSTADAGRTVYVGSRSSQVFVRIYEKGLEYAAALGLPVTSDLREWVRIEIEFKPQTDAAKQLAPVIEGPQLWGSTVWANQLANEVLSMSTQPVSIRERRESNRERALRFMGSQYSSHLRALLADCNGDLAEFGRAVADLANLLGETEQAA